MVAVQLGYPVQIETQPFPAEKKSGAYALNLLCFQEKGKQTSN